MVRVRVKVRGKGRLLTDGVEGSGDEQEARRDAKEKDEDPLKTACKGDIKVVGWRRVHRGGELEPVWWSQISGLGWGACGGQCVCEDRCEDRWWGIGARRLRVYISVP